MDMAGVHRFYTYNVKYQDAKVFGLNHCGLYIYDCNVDAAYASISCIKVFNPILPVPAGNMTIYQFVDFNECIGNSILIRELLTSGLGPFGWMVYVKVGF